MEEGAANRCPQVTRTRPTASATPSSPGTSAEPGVSAQRNSSEPVSTRARQPIPREGRSWATFADSVGPFDSMLSEYTDPQRAPELLRLREQVRSWRFYDQLRTDPGAPARQVRIGTRTPVLGHDGADLHPVPVAAGLAQPARAARMG